MLDNLKINVAGQAEIVSFGALMDGGSILLKLATVDNSELEIEFVQKVFPEVSMEYPYPGRLLLNRKPVDIRSDLETKILGILKNAVFCYPDTPSSLAKLNLKEWVALIITIFKKFPVCYPDTSYRLEKLILNECIAFVKSKKYLRLTNVETHKPWWKIG